MFLNVKHRENPQAARRCDGLNTDRIFVLIPLHTFICSQLIKADLPTHDLAKCQSPKFFRFWWKASLSKEFYHGWSFSSCTSFQKYVFLNNTKKNMFEDAVYFQSFNNLISLTEFFSFLFEWQCGTVGCSGVHWASLPIFRQSKFKIDSDPLSFCCFLPSPPFFNHVSAFVTVESIHIFPTG